MIQTLPKTIGFKTVLSLVIGSVIGAGIFMRPAEMAALLGSPALIMLAWLIAGLFTMLSVMILAEMAAMMPEDGGQYALMRNIYGDFWGYLFGWASFAVINCAATASLAFIFSQYLEYFIPLPSFSPTVERSFFIHIPLLGTVYPLEKFGVKCCSIFLLCLFTLISYRSTKSSGRLQDVFAVAKLCAIFILIAGFVSGQSGSIHQMTTPSLSIHPEGLALVLAMAAAVNGALAAYDGCSNMLNVTGEIRDPGRNIPKGLFWGMLISIAVYITITLGIMYVLTIDEMAASQLVAKDAALRSFGPVGAGLVAFFICLSVIGTVNACILTPPRITFAMARDNKFFKAAGVIHPKFKTPGNAMLLHLVWTVLLTLSGSFFMLADMSIFIVWLFNLFFVAGLFILRRRMPDVERPYKMWGYPWIPVLVFIGSLIFLALIVTKDIRNYTSGQSAVVNSVAAMALTAMGIPLYYFFKWANKGKDHAGISNTAGTPERTDQRN
jgi:APA family basic amino acid/polyamine antiporter